MILLQVRLELPMIHADIEEAAGKAFKMGKANKEDAVVFRIKDELEAFKIKLPVLEQMANPALKERHWKAVFALLNMDGVGYKLPVQS